MSSKPSNQVIPGQDLESNCLCCNIAGNTLHFQHPRFAPVSGGESMLYSKNPTL